MDQGAAAALATKVKSDVIDISNQRFDLEIVAPLVEEKQFIRKHGVPVIEDFTASLPSREVRLLNRINEIKNRCMEVYPAMLDERVEELRDVAPTLHNRYWKMYREVLMKRVYSKELGEYLEASSRLEGTIIRSMLDGLEASAKAYNFWQTCRNEKGVLYSGKERPKPRDT